MGSLRVPRSSSVGAGRPRRRRRARKCAISVSLVEHCGVASRKVPIDFACEVSASWKKACPSANFLVKFTKKETDDALDGDEGLELATHNYGRDEWWLLLDPVPVVE